MSYTSTYIQITCTKQNKQKKTATYSQQQKMLDEPNNNLFQYR